MVENHEIAWRDAGSSLSSVRHDGSRYGNFQAHGVSAWHFSNIIRPPDKYAEASARLSASYMAAEQNASRPRR